MPSKCLNHPDTFCDVCGEMTFKYQRQNFTPLIKKCYELYAGWKAGNQDKIWVRHICSVTCVQLFTGWVNGLHQMPFTIPMFWREPKDHSSNCYFCLTNITGNIYKSKHTVKYPILPPAMRPVSHSEELPVPKSPENLMRTLIQMITDSKKGKMLNANQHLKQVVPPTLQGFHDGV